METPCVEHIENLCSKQGGDNEKLIFKILKRGEKLKLETAKEEADLVDGGLRYDLTVPLVTILFKSMRTICRHRLRHCRWEMYGEQTVRREDVSVSSCSVILIFSVRHRISAEIELILATTAMLGKLDFTNFTVTYQ